MEETKELRTFYSFFQALVYATVLVEIMIFVNFDFGKATPVIARFGSLPIYANIFYSKLFTSLLIIITSIGTRAQKKLDLNPRKHIAVPDKINSTINANDISRLERGYNVGSIHFAELLCFYSKYIYIDSLFKEDFYLIETTGEKTAIKPPINSVAIKAISNATDKLKQQLKMITDELTDDLARASNLIK